MIRLLEPVLGSPIHGPYHWLRERPPARSSIRRSPQWQTKGQERVSDEELRDCHMSACFPCTLTKLALRVAIAIIWPTLSSVLTFERHVGGAYARAKIL